MQESLQATNSYLAAARSNSGKPLRDLNSHIEKKLHFVVKKVSQDFLLSIISIIFNYN